MFYRAPSHFTNDTTHASYIDFVYFNRMDRVVGGHIDWQQSKMGGDLYLSRKFKFGLLIRWHVSKQGSSDPVHLVRDTVSIIVSFSSSEALSL